METRFLSTTFRTPLISSSKKLLRRAMTMNGQSVTIVVIIVLAGLIVITSIVWGFLAYRYRKQKRVQSESRLASKAVYRKLHKPRPSNGSEDVKSEDIKDEKTTSASISNYIQQRGVDIEAQAHELDGESIYPEDDRTGSFLPSRLLPRSVSRRSQASIQSTSILERKTSLSSNHSYERHVREYEALISPELQRLMNEEPHPRPEPSRDQNQYSWEELLFPRAQYPQQRLPADTMEPSSYQQQTRHRTHSISESRSFLQDQQQSTIPSLSISQQQDSLHPPIPRKSSRRDSCPTSIDERVSAPTLLVTRPSTSTLDLTDKYELDGSAGKWQRCELGEQERGMLTVPRRISIRKSRSVER